MKDQNHHETQIVSTVRFLDIVKEENNRQILEKLGLGHQLRELERTCTSYLETQKARYNLLIDLELVRNRHAVRLKQIRKRANNVRRLMRYHTKDRADLQKILGVHPSQTPDTRNLEEQFGHWNKLLTGYRLLADGAFFHIILEDEARENAMPWRPPFSSTTRNVQQP